MKPPKRVAVSALAAPTPRPAGALASNAVHVQVAEAQRRGREVLAKAESAIAEFGQWLLVNVFADDARAVLDRPIDHPVWLALVQSAESAKLPLSRTALSQTLRVAALDKRLADGAWERLTFSHKATLSVLDDPKTLRAAARHVLAASLSVRQTQVYLQTLRENRLPPVKLSPTTALRSIARVHGRFESPQDVRKLATQLGKLDGDQRAQARTELEALVQVFSSLLESVQDKRG